MKFAVRLSVLLVTIVFANSCLTNKKIVESRSNVYPLSDTVTIAGGTLVYGLPRTVFTVIVQMERIIEKPGPYARYAGELLGLEDVIRNESEFWSITGVSVKTHEELDPSEYYVIRSNKLFLTNTLSLRKEGLILDLNPEAYNSISGNKIPKDQSFSQFNAFNLGSDEYFLLQRDTAYKRVSVDSLFIRIPYIVEKKKKLTIDQLAERAAMKLMELREGKHLILTGEATVYPQSEAAIKEINRMEKEYTELFTGKTWTDTKTFSYQIIPQKEMTGNPLTLFRFSELTGPAAGSAKVGVPVTVELTPEQKTKPLAVIKNNNVQLSSDTDDELYYRVPDVVDVRISLGSETLFNSRRLVYQLGEIVQLPSNYIIGK